MLQKVGQNKLFLRRCFLAEYCGKNGPVLWKCVMSRFKKKTFTLLDDVLVVPVLTAEGWRSWQLGWMTTSGIKMTGDLVACYFRKVKGRGLCRTFMEMANYTVQPMWLKWVNDQTEWKKAADQQLRLSELMADRQSIKVPDAQFWLPLCFELQKFSTYSQAIHLICLDIR